MCWKHVIDSQVSGQSAEPTSQKWDIRMVSDGLGCRWTRAKTICKHCVCWDNTCPIMSILNEMDWYGVICSEVWKLKTWNCGDSTWFNQDPHVFCTKAANQHMTYGIYAQALGTSWDQLSESFWGAAPMPHAAVDRRRCWKIPGLIWWFICSILADTDIYVLILVEYT